MKTQVYLGIVVRIIILILIGMFSTYLPDNLRDFFGDTPCLPDAEGNTYHCGGIDTQYLWGSRHYWYFWGMLILFLVSIINMIWSIINLIEKHYAEEFNK